MQESPLLWLPEPEPHDYPAAESYLTLHYGAARAADLAARLKQAPMVLFKAKDIFRASGLSLLGVSNSHVKRDKKKIRAGIGLSPLLLVAREERVLVADGYHRLCAIYSLDEDAVVPCKIA